MLVNSLMDGDTITRKKLITSIKQFNTDEEQHGTIKAIIKNLILPEENMAIKQRQSLNDKCIYSVPIKPLLPPASERTKNMNEAKKAFLNATVKFESFSPSEPKREPILHYAQIATIKDSDDKRSTGGGDDAKLTERTKSKTNTLPMDMPSPKKRLEQQLRKVSFKTRSASASYRRPPLVTKTTMTITSNKVSELTKKFNNIIQEGNNAQTKQSKLARTIENLQSASRHSASNSSTPSSTLSSSPNVKILLRQRRNSRKRGYKKRCSSVNSIDKLIVTNGSPVKFRVIRSKSDGTKIPKSLKKRLKYPDSSGQQSGSDSLDGTPTKQKTKELPKTENIEVPTEKNVVKNVIQKFECEIRSQANSSVTKKSTYQEPGNKVAIKEKPKVPVKKSSLVLTKNIVLKDGVPKIKTIKPLTVETSRTDKPSDKDVETSDKPEKTTNTMDENQKKKEFVYDKRKFKTNYIHSDKMPLHLVEIIQEDANESAIMNSSDNATNVSSNNVSMDDENSYQELNTHITPNDSFLWRRKSTQIYSDHEKSGSDSTYGFVSVIMNESTLSCSDSNGNDKEQSQENAESQVTTETELKNVDDDHNSDFESNLIEACNDEVLIGYTSRVKNAKDIEDDYELLEPREAGDVVVIPVKTDRSSKINCPLPEIPKDDEPVLNKDENIYQCLLEMRSHPEGDESSLHNYEQCGDHLEERTRGDGDSDDGYEYCKSPVKPYCHTSSSGIQIAEHYDPFTCDTNTSNYTITKSVSGTSTVSYEKIGPDRIYEKIPPRPPKSKETSPSYSSRHSNVSSEYTGYNETENIYDTIKHSDGTSLSHCYESIPNSPSMVKLRNNFKKQLSSAVQKRLSFDNVSNISHSTISSEQKTNSIYGQRSVISYNGQEIAFQVPCSETSVSDRSDDWVDVSDEEKPDQKIIIVRERSRGRKSPVSWSQKVRDQWQNSPKQSHDKDCDSSDSGHVYESLEPPPAANPTHHTPPPIPDDDFDSFDSDTDTDDQDKTVPPELPPTLPSSRLPTPPNGGPYTLTKIANAAQKKMKQIKRNLTKRYSVAMDGKPFNKSSSNQNGTYDVPKNQNKAKSPIYANYEKPEAQPVYSNINFHDTKNILHKVENPAAKISGTFKEELKTVIGEKCSTRTWTYEKSKNVSGAGRNVYEKGAFKASEKRNSNGDAPPPLPDKPPPEKPTTPTSDTKNSGTLSRKAYFSFKSRFRRATSMAVDINTDVPSALKITNSTFYLTDSIDGDSGFSNCSESDRREGMRAESSPCLALERPALPPPPPPPHPAHNTHTDLSAVNEGSIS